MGIRKILSFFPLLFLIKDVSAHCPLCTVGAVAAAGGAAYLGVDQTIIGLFIGAFAVSIGWWISKLIKKKYIPFQRELIIVFSFISTVIPILPLIGTNHPVYISLLGDYGSLLNRTYLFNMFLFGSIIGGAIVSITPWISNMVTKLRHGKLFPYQGISLTFAILIIASIILQILL